MTVLSRRCPLHWKVKQGKAVGKNRAVDLVLSFFSFPVDVARSKRPARELWYRSFWPLSSLLCAVAKKVPLRVHGVLGVLQVSI